MDYVEHKSESDSLSSQHDEEGNEKVNPLQSAPYTSSQEDALLESLVIQDGVTSAEFEGLEGEKVVEENERKSNEEKVVVDALNKVQKNF
ncbi:hypothetical protein Sjap_011003 [Stephania japonica]|uniref:Uncharacterized protein n=1 Tax=Stephania japonica TaxID=461633 RepID=A0AAP0JCI8_9MAGN